MKSERFRAVANKKTTTEEVTKSEKVLESKTIDKEAIVAKVETYKETEYPIELVDKQGHMTTEYVRVFIGLRNNSCQGRALVLLSNDRLYSVLTLSTKRILYSEELSVSKINAMDSIVQTHSKLIELLNSKVKELSTMTKTRRLIGLCKYLIDRDSQLSFSDAKDLDYCFDFGKKRWLYYSAALESWILLPKGWQKLNKIERYEFSLSEYTYEGLEIGNRVGCIATNKCYQWTGEAWEEIASPKDELGDEYLVLQSALEPNSLSYKTLVYSVTGWFCI